MRARLLGIAAKRRMKGFSSIIEEALEEYLKRDAVESEKLEKALAAKNSLDDGEAELLERALADLRKAWR